MSDGDGRLSNLELAKRYLNPKHENYPKDVLDDPDIKESLNRDLCGFYHPNGLSKRDRAAEAKSRRSDLHRFNKWLKMVTKWEAPDSVWNRMYHNGRASEKLTRRIFKGIPRLFRMIVWPLLLFVPDVKSKHVGVYSKLLNYALAHSTALYQIDLDINRTFRNSIYFRDRYGPRQQALFRVLAVYSVYDSEVGYCQGMSELAGLFLMFIEDEEDAFWALVQIMTDVRHSMHSVYKSNFPGLTRLFAHHDRVLRKLLPPLHKHFKTHEMLPSTYALKWFMQCFLNRLPVTLVLRLWDIYLYEGEKLLIAMAYNILKMHNKRLLRMDQVQMTSFLQDDLVKDFLFDDDVVIDSLKDCFERLRKAKLDILPALTVDMLPTKLGVIDPDSVWENRNDLKIDYSSLVNGSVPNLSCNLRASGTVSSASDLSPDISLSTGPPSDSSAIQVKHSLSSSSSTIITPGPSHNYEVDQSADASSIANNMSVVKLSKTFERLNLVESSKPSHGRVRIEFAPDHDVLMKNRASRILQHKHPSPHQTRSIKMGSTSFSLSRKSPATVDNLNPLSTKPTCVQHSIIRKDYHNSVYTSPHNDGKTYVNLKAKSPNRWNSEHNVTVVRVPSTSSETNFTPQSMSSRVDNNTNDLDQLWLKRNQFKSDHQSPPDNLVWDIIKCDHSISKDKAINSINAKQPRSPSQQQRKKMPNTTDKRIESVQIIHVSTANEIESPRCQMQKSRIIIVPSRKSSINDHKQHSRPGSLDITMPSPKEVSRTPL